MKQAGNLYVVSLGKALNEAPSSKCGRQMAGNSKASSYSAPSFSGDSRIKMQINKIFNRLTRC